ncbi:MAG: hypothetical protein ACYDBT_09645 [Desulfobulbaceae bacterium]
MKNRTAEEILSITFAHLDKVLLEKRNDTIPLSVNVNARSSPQRELGDPARPEKVAAVYALWQERVKVKASA